MASSTIQTLAWLGDPPPLALSAALQDFVDLHEGWIPLAGLVAVWMPSGTEVLTGLPRPGSRPPIVAIAPRRPAVAERLAWIRAGADSVVALPDAAAALLAGLYPDGPPAPRPPPEPEPEPFIAPPIPEELPAAEEPQEPAADDPPTEPMALQDPDEPGLVIDTTLPDALPGAPRMEHDLIAELSPDDDSSQGVLSKGDRARLLAVLLYLERRAIVAARLGANGLQELLEVCRLRDQADRSRAEGRAADPFGQTRGADTPPLRWQCAIATEIDEHEPSTVLTLGSDGLVLTLARPVAANQPLRVLLPVDIDTTVTFLVETRWQRRVSASLWHIGASIEQATLIGPPTS